MRQCLRPKDERQQASMLNIAFLGIFCQRAPLAMQGNHRHLQRAGMPQCVLSAMHGKSSSVFHKYHTTFGTCGLHVELQDAALVVIIYTIYMMLLQPMIARARSNHIHATVDEGVSLTSNDSLSWEAHSRLSWDDVSPSTQ